MHGLTRKPGFWIAYFALAIAALGVAAKLFPLAIPLVNLDVRLARHEAIDKAREIAAREKLAPPQAKVAAQFGHDGAAQDYIELEGGGKEAFAALVAGDRYAPYWWDVRLFQPGSIDEVTIRFKPDGAQDGFNRRLPEDYVREPATMALSADAARTLALEQAKRSWGVDFVPYRLLEQSEQTRPSGRVDHAFVYERPEALGEARIRLRLGVAGDELVQLVPSIHVPESFERRYQELRSANNLIAGIASAGAGLLYGLGGCILGALWLLRQRALLWRPALGAGLIVGGLMAAAALADAQSAWMGFDTAQSESTFWLEQGGRALAILVGGSLGYALVFMAAEGLSRRAFPHQPQLWRLWSREAGASVQALGRTAGGYLFVPLELGLIIAFYYASNRWLGWWQPSEALSDPNILSSAIPALQPIALSLQAGFMEECLFRAVPLALGALIGARFGSRGAGIAIAFVLQALLFGGAHANYPGFPAYSRLVELIVPSLMWAWIFLRFGLLPTILLHAVFDLALMSIPVFLVDAPGATAQRALVIAAGAVPLVIVVLRRMQLGAFVELPPALRNGAWRPAAASVQVERRSVHRQAQWTPKLQRALPVLAAAGLVAWLVSMRVGTDVPPLTIDRAQAIAAAEGALARRDVNLPPQWRRMADIQSSDADAPQLFVWREAGPARDRALVGEWLPPPVWQVRFATFEGDVAERAEEWQVTVDGSGNVRRVRHVLPEGRAGAQLSREDALAIASRELAAELGLDSRALAFVAGEDKARPARSDWSFVWHDPRVDVGAGGQARVRAELAGAEVIGVARYVHVPEPWLRAEQERQGRLTGVKLGVAIVLAMGAIAALVMGILGWGRGAADVRASLLVGGFVFVLTLGRAALGWPEAEAGFTTSEPFAAQAATRIVGAVIGAIGLAVIGGLLAGIGSWWARTAPRRPLATWLPPWCAGCAAALATGGAFLLAARAFPDVEPAWPSYPFEDAALPALAAALSVLRFPLVVAVALFLLAVLSRVTDGGTRRRWLLPLLLALAFGAESLQGAGAPPSAIVAAAAAGLFAAMLIDAVLCADPRTVSAFLATAALVAALDMALAKATTQGYLLFAIQAVCLLVTAWLVQRYLDKPLPGTPSAREPEASPGPG
jgi:hypothetical protein